MSKRLLLGALGGLVIGAIVGGSIGLVLGGADQWNRALLLGGIGIAVGIIGGAVAADPKKVFGSSNDRMLKRLRPLIEKVNSFEDGLKALSDDELRGKTEAFRQRIREGSTAERAEVERLKAQLREPVEDGPTPEAVREAISKAEDALYKAEQVVLDEILPEAFACVREASRRTTGLRHYDVQILGGIVLHRGTIAEMKTGEGKTLVATLPIYLNALTGRGVHLVTVNDYLARRDVQWMGPIYHALGVSSASIVHDLSFVFDPTVVVKDYRLINLRQVERKEAYGADITYGTNHEFGFDYLRDNMKFSLDDYVQRELTYSIVDEVDNILIDEARTPLIISGPADESTDKYGQIDRVVPRLRRGATTVGDVRAEDRAAIDAQGDYTVDEKGRHVHLTEAGVAKVERMLNIHNLYDPGHIDILHHVNQALRAHTLYERDVHYIVKDGQVIIVDEFTGRLMPGRRWSDGLHQAVEAKEGVRIERENQTLATITIQNYFRMYRKLAGMTGTADTEAAEFKKIYKLDVTVIPPNRTTLRIDHPDVVYKSKREKLNAVVDQIAECNERQQPVLVGTISVEKSEELSKLLKQRKVKHNVLNAVNHEAEANIIAQAGRLGAVTIATNMAGRGTDILLGGNPEFLARAEMENDWVKRNANLPGAGLRYEEVLANLRDQFDAAVEDARKAHEPNWGPLAEAQAKALEDLTAAHRAFLDAEYWQSRTEYDRLLTAAGAEGGEAFEACAVAVERYSTALQGLDRVTGPHFGEEGQERFQRAVSDWVRSLRESASNGSGAITGPLRTAFDRVRTDYERAMQRVLIEPTEMPDGVAAKRALDEVTAIYQQSEVAYAEARTPYEAAVAQARDAYEEERKKYTRVIDEVREQMEAAPEENRGRYGEALQKYKELCAIERQQVSDAGGLFILGTERHESRRIDNQLRGRAGRQGDPGASRFFLSLEDDLLRIFGAERIQGLMTRLGMEEGEPIEHRLITRAIANAQSKVEAHNFDVRKHLLEYDDVMNKQREVIYGQRRVVLGGETLTQQVWEITDGVIERVIDEYAPADTPSHEWDWQALSDAIAKQFNIGIPVPENPPDVKQADLEEDLRKWTRAAHAQREQAFTPPVMRQLEKFVLLQTIDQLWKEHLLNMDHLKEGIGLRGYAQKNPLQEYQKEGFAMFEDMIDRIHSDAVQKVFTVQAVRQEELQRLEQRRQPQEAQMTMSGGGEAPRPVAGRPAAAARRAGGIEQPKAGRNDPCPCGSGKKYKKCHGA
jgi:preprotein translocase SecA subunit